MIPFSIAGVQMHVPITGENVSAMSVKVDHLMLRFPWVEMVVFSELSAFGPLHSNIPKDLSETEKTFKECARRNGVWLIPGSWFVRENGHLFNEAIVVNPDGEIVSRYRKMFPFMPYEHGVTGGSEFCVFDVPGIGRFGLSICYDIWFPETTRQLTAMGAEVLLHPVMTGTIDRDIELSIARSTAAINQCYVFDINGIGAGGTGRSCVVDPSGSVLYQAAGQDEVIPVEVDMDVVRRQRAVGLRGLGQTLKSFRDRNCTFPVYDNAAFDLSYLNSLGSLSMPKKGNQLGIGVPTPSEITGVSMPKYQIGAECD